MVFIFMAAEMGFEIYSGRVICYSSGGHDELRNIPPEAEWIPTAHVESLVRSDHRA